VYIPKTKKFFLAAIAASCLALISCGGGDPVTQGGALFTNAPAQSTLDAGASTTFRVNGGNLPYRATSGNPNIVQARQSGTDLSLTAVSPGTTTVSVVDAQGQRVDLQVSVLPLGQSVVALTLTPDALTVGNCTTRLPFLFSGGTPPYTVLTSDIFSAPVSSALDLAPGRSYFFADLKFPLGSGGLVTLTVLDSQSRTVVSRVTAIPSSQPCPSNPLLLVSPESANFRLTEILAFQISGGPTRTVPPTMPIVTFSDGGVAEVVSLSDTTINVQARRPGPTLMTVATADGQRASIVINVLPQP
jgi:hypothetical protein